MKILVLIYVLAASLAFTQCDERRDKPVEPISNQTHSLTN
jgi:hypothetical protein